MNSKLTQALDSVFSLGVLSLTLLVPLFFWNLTSEFYETPKFLILVSLTLLLLLIGLLKYVSLGRVTYTKTPLDLAFLLLLVILVISTFFSASRPVSIMGNLPRIQGGLASYLAFILLYFVLASHIKTLNIARQAVSALLFGGIILAVVALLSYFNIYLLPLAWTHFLNFSPSGNIFSLQAILTFAVPFLIASISGSPKNIISAEATDQAEVNLKEILGENAVKVVLAAVLSLFLVAIFLTGTPTIYIATALVFLLSLKYLGRNVLNKNLPYLVSPLLIVAFVAVLSFLPLIKAKNPFYNSFQNFPREIQLPLDISWKVAISSFRDSPFWGSGPATFLFDFTNYKPLEFNSTPFWNNKFDQAADEYLQTLSTLGAAGLITLLLLTLLFISIASKTIRQRSANLPNALAISAVSFFILLALHAATLVVWVLGILLLALYMSTDKEATEELHFGIAASKTKDNSVSLHFDAFPIALFAIFLVLVALVAYFTGKAALADYHHRLALQAVNAGQGLIAYNELVKAEGLNPYADTYRLDLAQTNFALANAIAASKGPTQASPAGSLTDTDKQNIQTLLSQAVTEGRTAVTLSPNNAGSWEILGSIYRQISGVAQNALSFALDSYGRAIQKDPLNPSLRLSVGGIYYSIKNYELAIRFFTDAINLKPDYANAYYNLAVALRDNKNLTDATVAAEKTVSLVDPKSNDYKIASNLLADLKAESASKTAELKNTETAPAAKTSSALQGKNLPQVLNLPQPENLATPAAVKK